MRAKKKYPTHALTLTFTLAHALTYIHAWAYTHKHLFKPNRLAGERRFVVCAFSKYLGFHHRSLTFFRRWVIANKKNYLILFIIVPRAVTNVCTSNRLSPGPQVIKHFSIVVRTKSTIRIQRRPISFVRSFALFRKLASRSVDFLIEHTTISISISDISDSGLQHRLPNSPN